MPTETPRIEYGANSPAGAPPYSTQPGQIHLNPPPPWLRTTNDFWPLCASLLLAGGLLWLQPAREISALLLGLGYLGLCLHYWRQHRAANPDAHTPPGELLIAYASQGGQAQQLAEQSRAQLAAAGLPARCLALNQLSLERLRQSTRVIFVVSTYGEGEAPDNAARFERQLLARQPALADLQYAILALGDSHYRQFCAFGKRLDSRLRALQAQPLFDLLQLDRGAPASLRHWQQQLGHISGDSAFVDWQPAHYQPWQLQRRAHLNPGSSGAPLYHLSLRGPTAEMRWQAGDIVEIGPRQPPQRVNAWLHSYGLDPATPLADGQTLGEALSRRQLPDTLAMATEASPAQLLASLAPLPHREYSIASSSACGQLELLVRQHYQAEGQPGLGSGWLCQYAALGGSIDLRIRSNPAFHGPTTPAPLILIGSGSGMAGLRAHLLERQHLGQPGHWLLFGERNAACDRCFDDQLQAWLASGHLARLDRAFSRDQEQRVYVQHLLRDAADELRAWLARDACLLVCGSLEGMGREVDAMLHGLLGRDNLDALRSSGRYRRDLY
ncbi:Sulfite reductase [NADPH] flavoprotein alpha-component [compost metagenome]